MNVADDLASLLADWDTATIAGRDYRGVFNHEVYPLDSGVDRVPTFTMRTRDAEAVTVEQDTKVTITGQAFKLPTVFRVRGQTKLGDGAETVLILASVPA